MKKHILIISQYFYPEQFRINDIALEWVKRGYKVSVLTGIPNYPLGKFYNGYGWFTKRKEIWNGINIIRIPLFPRGKKTSGLILNYISFVVSGFFWKCFSKLKADLVFTFEVSPMTQALIGVWYAKKHKIPNYLYVQDLWPENVEIVTGIHSKVVIEPISKMVNYIYKNCNKIFATSPSFVTEIRKRIPDSKNNVIYWPQYAEEFYRPLPQKNMSEIVDDNRFKIIFTGNIGKAQGLEILPLAAKNLKDNGINNIAFFIVGDGRQKAQLESDIQALGVEDMFCLIGYQPTEKIPELLAACDVAFVSFANNPLLKNTIPAKLQSYMACGMPILASAAGETERIIYEARCGICCEIGNATVLANGINELRSSNLTEMSRNSRTYFKKHFQKQDLMDEMDAYFEHDAHA